MRHSRRPRSGLLIALNQRFLRIFGFFFVEELFFSLKNLSSFLRDFPEPGLKILATTRLAVWPRLDGHFSPRKFGYKTVSLLNLPCCQPGMRYPTI